MQFPTTLWTQIRQAGQADRQAGEEVARRYLPAIVSYLRLRGFSEGDSDDLAQDVFVRLFGEKILLRAEKERGRFRSLVIAVAKQAIGDALRRRSAQKRGGGVAHVDIAAAMTEDAEDEEFDRGWASNLLSLALQRLREECERTGMAYHRALAMHLAGKSYDEIAAAMTAALTNVSTWIRRARQRVKGYVDEEIRAYSSSREEYSQETRRMARLLGTDEA